MGTLNLFPYCFVAGPARKMMSLIKIFVADAQLLFAEALQASLRLQPDFSVIEETPSSGLKVVEAVTASAPDVAILDYWLEGMQGPAAARLIRHRRPDQKIIFLAWLHQDVDLGKAAAAGAAAMLSKDNSLERLAETIHGVHAGKTYLRLKPKSRQANNEAEEAWAKLVTLTPREIEIIGRLAKAGRPEEVAAELSLTIRTVRLHIEHILAKTGARSHLEAVLMATKYGLI